MLEDAEVAFLQSDPARVSALENICRGNEWPNLSSGNWTGGTVAPGPLSGPGKPGIPAGVHFGSTGCAGRLAVRHFFFQFRG